MGRHPLELMAEWPPFAPIADEHCRFQDGFMASWLDQIVSDVALARGVDLVGIAVRCWNAGWSGAWPSLAWSTRNTRTAARRPRRVRPPDRGRLHQRDLVLPKPPGLGNARRIGSAEADRAQAGPAEPGAARLERRLRQRRGTLLDGHSRPRGARGGRGRLEGPHLRHRPERGGAADGHGGGVPAERLESTKLGLLDQYFTPSGSGSRCGPSFSGWCGSRGTT